MANADTIGGIQADSPEIKYYQTATVAMSLTMIEARIDLPTTDQTYLHLRIQEVHVNLTLNEASIPNSAPAHATVTRRVSGRTGVLIVAVIRYDRSCLTKIGSISGKAGLIITKFVEAFLNGEFHSGYSCFCFSHPTIITLNDGIASQRLGVFLNARGTWKKYK